VASPRRSRSGLVAAAMSLALLVALVVYPLAQTGELARFVVVPAALAVALLVTAFVLRLPALVPWAFVPLFGEYAAFLLLEGSDRLAPLFAAGAVLAAELGYWGVEPQALAAGRVTARRWLTLGLVTATSAAVALFVLGASRVDLGGGLGLEALGVAAAVGALALLAALARGRPTR
jgi:hypothetical protein